MEKQQIRRLFAVSSRDIIRWQKLRAENGREQYKDAHLQRYGLVDVAEEIFDAMHILALAYERIYSQTITPNPRVVRNIADRFARTNNLLGEVFEELCSLDRQLSHHVCSDEQGGVRVGWNELESGKFDIEEE